MIAAKIKAIFSFGGSTAHSNSNRSSSSSSNSNSGSNSTIRRSVVKRRYSTSGSSSSSSSGTHAHAGSITKQIPNTNISTSLSTNPNTVTSSEKSSEYAEYKWDYLDEVDIVKVVNQFYDKFNPEKKRGAEYVCNQFKGQEYLMLQQLCERYSVPQSTMQSIINQSRGVEYDRDDIVSPYRKQSIITATVTPMYQSNMRPLNMHMNSERSNGQNDDNQSVSTDNEGVVYINDPLITEQIRNSPINRMRHTRPPPPPPRVNDTMSISTSSNQQQNPNSHFLNQLNQAIVSRKGNSDGNSHMHTSSSSNNSHSGSNNSNINSSSPGNNNSHNTSAANDSMLEQVDQMQPLPPRSAYNTIPAHTVGSVSQHKQKDKRVSHSSKPPIQIPQRQYINSNDDITISMTPGKAATPSNSNYSNSNNLSQPRQRLLTTSDPATTSNHVMRGSQHQQTSSHRARDSNADDIDDRLHRSNSMLLGGATDAKASSRMSDKKDLQIELLKRELEEMRKQFQASNNESKELIESLKQTISSSALQVQQQPKSAVKSNKRGGTESVTFTPFDEQHDDSTPIGTQLQLVKLELKRTRDEFKQLATELLASHTVPVGDATNYKAASIKKDPHSVPVSPPSPISPTYRQHGQSASSSHRNPLKIRMADIGSMDFAMHTASSSRKTVHAIDSMHAGDKYVYGSYRSPDSTSRSGNSRASSPASNDYSSLKDTQSNDNASSHNNHGKYRPYDWVECIDKFSKRKYYFSTFRNKSVWTKPIRSPQPYSDTPLSPKNNPSSASLSKNSSRASSAGSREVERFDKYADPHSHSKKPPLLRLSSDEKEFSFHKQPVRSASSERGRQVGKGRYAPITRSLSPSFRSPTAESPYGTAPYTPVATKDHSDSWHKISRPLTPTIATDKADKYSGSSTSKWQVAIDPKSNRKYYYNKELRKSFWKRPFDFDG